jgi:tetratricopeptide (TPR) repeat protein
MIRFLLFLFSINLSFNIWAENDRHRGLNFLEKKEYVPVLAFFLDYSAQPDLSALEKEDVDYYIALCRVMINNSDRLSLIKYAQAYPQGNKLNLVYYELGNSWFLDNEFEKAVEYYKLVDKSFFSKPLVDELIYKMGYCLLNIGDMQAASEYFAMSKSDDNFYKYSASYYSGYVDLENGNYDDAIASLNLASMSADYKALVPYLLSKAYYEQGLFTELINYLKKINDFTELNNSDQIKFFEAESYFLLGGYDKAATCYEDYIIMNDLQVDQQVLYRLAYCFYKSRNFDKALQYFHKLCSVNGEIGQLSNYYVGIIYFEQKKKLEALSCLKKAYEMSTDLGNKIFEEIAFTYAKLNYALNKFSVAIDVLEKLLKQGIQNKYANEANNLLFEISELITKSYLYTGNYGSAIEYINKLPHKEEAILKIYQQVTYKQGLDFIVKNQHDKALEILVESSKYSYDQELFINAKFWIAEIYSLQENYDQAISVYTSLLDSAGKNNLTTQVLYGLGYCYYNKQDYAAALNNFKKCVSSNNSNYINKKVFRDAVLRLADCCYATKDYTKALKYYESSIASNYELDHSYYYEATIYSILGNIDKANTCLHYIIDRCKGSIFYDRALYERAHLHFKAGNYDLAISLFTAFINEKPHSTMLSTALMNRATAYINLNKKEEAISDYEKILKHFSNDAQSVQNALIELRKLVGAEKFTTYINDYKHLSKDVISLETLELETAKELFYKQNYPEAIVILLNFTKHKSGSVFFKDAMFLLAECYYRLSDLPVALEHYYNLLKYDNVPMYSRVLNRIADIQYVNNNFSDALDYYIKLKDNANNKKEVVYAKCGMMKCYFELGNYGYSDKYANELNADAFTPSDIKSDCSLIQAKVAIKKNDHNKAIEILKNLKPAVKLSDQAVELSYLLASELYHIAEYQQSLDLLFALNKDYHDKKAWINRSFLLIADNYISLNDFVQAKATLNSIIEKSEDPLTISQAKEKLSMVVEKEAGDIRLYSNKDSSNIIHEDNSDEVTDKQ